MQMEYATLNTGAKMPLLGLGTWQAKDEAEVESAIRAALDAGYTHFDTAFLYFNEAFIGKVLKEYISAGKVKREDLFIVTKLPMSAHYPELVEKCVEYQLQQLQLDYVDLYLIHGPCPFKNVPGSLAPEMKDGKLVPVDVPLIDTWRELEKLHKKGKLRAIGISNFGQKQLKDLYEKAEVKPANQQVECHIYWPQHGMHKLCTSLGVIVTAYAPIGSPGRKDCPAGEPLKEALVLELAKKYGKSPAQILIRQMTQRGIVAIPKSTNSKRLLENISIFDFKLNAEEVEKLNNLNINTGLFDGKMFSHHPNVPWEDIDPKLRPSQ